MLAVCTRAPRRRDVRVVGGGSGRELRRVLALSKKGWHPRDIPACVLYGNLCRNNFLRELMWYFGGEAHHPLFYLCRN